MQAVDLGLIFLTSTKHSSTQKTIRKIRVKVDEEQNDSYTLYHATKGMSVHHLINIRRIDWLFQNNTTHICLSLLAHLSSQLAYISAGRFTSIKVQAPYILTSVRQEASSKLSIMLSFSKKFHYFISSFIASFSGK